MNNIYKMLPDKKLSKINIAKIAIIVFSSLYLIGNFDSYHEGRDSLVYALSAIELSNGSYQMSNVLFENSGKSEFVPNQWTKTTQSLYIPKANPGFPSLVALAYLVANDYGLFYLGPIFTIALLISSERIATKLFNDRVGFLALLFLSTNFMIFSIGTRLLTDTAFAFLIIWGIYYFLKFLKNNNNNAIILSSLFFVTASLIRVVGIIFLPLEIFLFIGYLIFYSIRDKKEDKTSNGKFYNKFLRFVSRKNILLFFIFLIIPWVGFGIFWSSFNSYYFGDPFTSYGDIWAVPTKISEFGVNKTLIYDSPIPMSIYEQQLAKESYDRITVSSQRVLLIEDRFEVARGYFLYLLPSQFPWAQTVLEPYEQDYGKDFLGIISILFLPTILILSIKTKYKRKETMVFLSAIIAIIGIFSIISIPDTVIGRYILPAIPFFSILFGYFIVKIFEIIPNVFVSKPILSKSIKSGFLVFLVIYFTFAFFISDPIQYAISDSFKFKNPEDYRIVYPLDREGISENSILVNYYGSRALEYDLIPFDGNIGNYFLFYSPEEYPIGSVKLLKTAINLGYDAYVLKNPNYIYEKEYYRFLLNQTLVLKDFSKSFCKIELGINSSTGITPEPDEICYKEVLMPSEKRWYDNLIKQ